MESCDKENKTVLTNFNKQIKLYKTQNFYILLGFLLITIELLTAVSICHYLIKYRAKKSTCYHFISQIMYQNKLCIDNVRYKRIMN